jgi:hypothetical protein
MSTEQPENKPISSLETETLQSTSSRFEVLGWRLIRWWGIIFRALFICAIGVIGYSWIDPQSIDDIPLSQLTLKHIFRNLIALLIAIGCAKWFFEFPDQKGDSNVEGNPYVTWGQFGFLVVVIGVLGIYWVSN